MNEYLSPAGDVERNPGPPKKNNEHKRTNLLSEKVTKRILLQPVYLETNPGPTVGTTKRLVDIKSCSQTGQDNA